MHTPSAVLRVVGIVHQLACHILASVTANKPSCPASRREAPLLSRGQLIVPSPHALLWSLLRNPELVGKCRSWCLRASADPAVTCSGPRVGEELSRPIEPVPQETAVSKPGPHHGQASVEFMDRTRHALRSDRRMTPGRLSPGQLARAGWHCGFKHLAMLHISATQLGTSCQSPRGLRCDLLHSWSCQPLSLIHDDRLDELKCAGWAVPRGMWWGGHPRHSLWVRVPGPPPDLGDSLWGWGLGDTSFHRPVVLHHGRGREPWWNRRESAVELDRPE